LLLHNQTSLPLWITSVSPWVLTSAMRALVSPAYHTLAVLVPLSRVARSASPEPAALPLAPSEDPPGVPAPPSDDAPPARPAMAGRPRSALSTMVPDRPSTFAF
jgi:hypothetical protein